MFTSSDASPPTLGSSVEPSSVARGVTFWRLHPSIPKGLSQPSLVLVQTMGVQSIYAKIVPAVHPNAQAMTLRGVLCLRMISCSEAFRQHVTLLTSC